MNEKLSGFLPYTLLNFTFSAEFTMLLRFDKISPTMCDIFAKPQIAVCIFTRAVLFIFSKSQWVAKVKTVLLAKKTPQNVQVYKIEEHHIKLFEEPLDSR